MDYDKIAPMMRRLWAPIAIVTASSQGRDNAQAAVSIGGASIVADRPRVVVQLYKTNLTHDLVVESGAFALCFARRDQLDLVHDTGLRQRPQAGDKMAGLAYSKGATGSPVLDDCLGFLDCRVINAMDGGDMTVFLADVVDGGMRSDGEPLDGPTGATSSPSPGPTSGTRRSPRKSSTPAASWTPSTLPASPPVRQQLLLP